MSLTGQLLLAMPQMLDERFARSVVYVCAHSGEAGAMGLVGGVCGVTIGWLIGEALTWGTTFYLKTQDLPGVKISSVPWWLATGAIAFAVIVSLIAGLYPASRAAKLNPVEALRYE